VSWKVRTTDFIESSLYGGSHQSSKKEMLLLSLKKLAGYWLLAVFCIFVPILHFFLVPFFLISGVFAFYSQMKNTHSLATGFYQCPSCSEKVELKNFSFHADKRFSCERCGIHLVLFQAPEKNGH
jgi:ribosomal protein S27AE